MIAITANETRDLTRVGVPPLGEKKKVVVSNRAVYS